MTRTHQPDRTGDDVAAGLREVAGELARGHDTLVASHDALLARYAELAHALVALSRRLGTGLGDAVPVGADGDLLDDVDRDILAALDRGTLHTQLARDLGIARRTVNRRLQRLRRITGTTSPFQLGRAAAALGWLPATPEPSHR